MKNNDYTSSESLDSCIDSAIETLNSLRKIKSASHVSHLLEELNNAISDIVHTKEIKSILGNKNFSDMLNKNLEATRKKIPSMDVKELIKTWLSGYHPECLSLALQKIVENEDKYPKIADLYYKLQDELIKFSGVKMNFSKIDIEKCLDSMSDATLNNPTEAIKIIKNKFKLSEEEASRLYHGYCGDKEFSRRGNFSNRITKLFSNHGVGFRDPLWKGPNKLIIDNLGIEDKSLTELIKKYKNESITVLQFKKNNTVSIYLPGGVVPVDVTLARVPIIDTKFAGTNTQYGVINFTTKKLSELQNNDVRLLGTYCIAEHGEVFIYDFND